MANKPTPDKTAKVSPGQTQGKATRSRRELKKKLKKAGHVAIAATELEKFGSFLVAPRGIAHYASIMINKY